MVRSLKDSLKEFLNEFIMLTVIVNRRPIIPMSQDPFHYNIRDPNLQAIIVRQHCKLFRWSASSWKRENSRKNIRDFFLKGRMLETDLTSSVPGQLAWVSFF